MGQSNSNSPSVETRELRDPQAVQHLDEDTLDPNMYYRWTNERPSVITRRLAKGYRFVDKETDGVRTLFGQEDGTGDNRIRNADTVLMCIPKKHYEKGREEIARITRSRLGSPKASFKKKARQRGVKIDDKDE